MQRKNSLLNIFCAFVCIIIFVYTVSALSDTPSYSEDKFENSTVRQSMIGRRQEDIADIQRRMKEYGLYTGEINGSYDRLTANAVQWLEQCRSLDADGIAGADTLYELELPNGGAQGSYSQAEIDLLARLISAEARGEPYEGQVAVGAVVLNRVEHPSFPDSISGVCYQSGAFSCVDNGHILRDPEESCIRAAYDALSGIDPTGGAIYFYNPDTASCEWIRTREVVVTIGDHCFCI